MGKKRKPRGPKANTRGTQGRSRRRRRPSDQGVRPAPASDVEPVENGDAEALQPGRGMLELHPNGYGFLRSPDNNYDRVRSDPFVPGTMIEKYRLREGLMISGLVQRARKQQGPRLREITDVDGMPPDEYVNVKTFDELTPINPRSWLRLETGPEPLSTRVMDLLTPLGKGQRALVVAPRAPARRSCCSISPRVWRRIIPVSI